MFWGSPTAMCQLCHVFCDVDVSKTPHTHQNWHMVWHTRDMAHSAHVLTCTVALRDTSHIMVFNLITVFFISSSLLLLLLLLLLYRSGVENMLIIWCYYYCYIFWDCYEGDCIFSRWLCILGVTCTAQSTSPTHNNCHPEPYLRQTLHMFWLTLVWFARVSWLSRSHDSSAVMRCFGAL